MRECKRASVHLCVRARVHMFVCACVRVRVRRACLWVRVLVCVRSRTRESVWYCVCACVRACVIVCGSIGCMHARQRVRLPQHGACVHSFDWAYGRRYISASGRVCPLPRQLGCCVPATKSDDERYEHSQPPGGPHSMPGHRHTDQPGLSSDQLATAGPLARGRWRQLRCVASLPLGKWR